ncbi:MAG TPA: TrkA family potassium uptake protein [Firmicutes bacterium]|uniref:potassium channel family protein n=1 Tax=Gelria sp. Kuro-4 TaxID=2796927 RepID=UPI0019C2F2A5|nr:TrkA family potassium uptake protein [Gelria sp. Kuro-4]MDI3521840.1 trk/ktr system potassium uptake protein [Bacillota bacterium]BCV25277.1 potassium transporter Trk [Gelria sp. Kuro-4]HHV56506.1 TrkA family potassium uptake protein [Bacillota bacterium]
MKRQFAVIGLGRFGSSVARTLFSMGYDVLAVDVDGERVQDLAKDVTHAVQGDAREEETLRAVGIRNFDVVVVAIGQDIQSSILITVLLKELGVKCVVAKAQNELHAKVLYKVGADKVVFPERDMGARLARNMVAANILDYIQLSPDYSIVEVATSENWEGKTLRELNLRARFGINVLAIKRDKKLIVAPGAEDLLHKGDILVVVGSNANIDQLERV